MNPRIKHTLETGLALDVFDCFIVKLIANDFFYKFVQEFGAGMGLVKLVGNVTVLAEVVLLSISLFKLGNGGSVQVPFRSA